MSTLTKSPTLSKIKTLSEIEKVVEDLRQSACKIVQCHGVFDLLHPGHIRHFREAKQQGDKLIVTITPDRFVNKGPGRPAFTEALRLEAIAALSDVDYVVLNDAPDACSVIRKIRPSFYVKGIEYSDHAKDVTGKISEETRALQEGGGVIYYTNDIVFSSSQLINRHIDVLPPHVQSFMDDFKRHHSSGQLIGLLESLQNLKVLVIGDAIIDEYQYVEPMGQSGKGLHMCVRACDRDLFLGGSLIIANHVAQFTKQVTLLTAVGRECPHLSFIRNHLSANVQSEFIFVPDAVTLAKKRYVLKDGGILSKLFETYSGLESALPDTETNQVLDHLGMLANSYDVIIACDFGNGFTNAPIIDAISATSSFLALNTQINSGNRGYNVVTNYRRADFISLNEPELRLAAHNKTSPVEQIAADICQIMHCPTISVTRGVKGVLSLSRGDVCTVPALATTSVDRIGAGDSYLSLTSLCLAKGAPLAVSSFIGSLASAMSVQTVGNAEPIRKDALCKFMIRMLK